MDLMILKQSINHLDDISYNSAFFSVNSISLNHANL